MIMLQLKTEETKPIELHDRSTIRRFQSSVIDISIIDKWHGFEKFADKKLITTYLFTKIHHLDFFRFISETPKKQTKKTKSKRNDAIFWKEDGDKT